MLTTPCPKTCKCYCKGQEKGWDPGPWRAEGQLGCCASTAPKQRPQEELRGCRAGVRSALKPVHSGGLSVTLHVSLGQELPSRLASALCCSCSCGLLK